MKLIVIFFSLLLFFGSKAHGLLIEPYLGYESGETKYMDGSLAGTQYGLRLAHEAPVFFWGGVDIASAMVKMKSSSGGDVDYNKSTVYGVVGINFPVLIRAWLAYGFYNQLTANNANMNYKGSANKVGLGFKVAPLISLNVEYLNEEYSELNGVTLITSQPLNEGYILSLSIPW